MGPSKEPPRLARAISVSGIMGTLFSLNICSISSRNVAL